jgi:hypothetical protein
MLLEKDHHVHNQWAFPGHYHSPIHDCRRNGGVVNFVTGKCILRIEGHMYSDVTVGTSKPPSKRRADSKKQEKRVLAWWLADKKTCIRGFERTVQFPDSKPLQTNGNWVSYCEHSSGRLIWKLFVRHPQMLMPCYIIALEFFFVKLFVKIFKL